MSPALRDELGSYKARSRFTEPTDPVFATGRGRPIHASNLDGRVLHPAVERANAALAKRERPVIEHASMHTLRRTYISLLLEAGATVPSVMKQAGHRKPDVTLSIYAAVLDRTQDAGAQMDALISRLGERERV